MFCAFLKRKPLAKLILKEMLILFFYWDRHCLELETKDSKHLDESKEGYHVELGSASIGLIRILFYALAWAVTELDNGFINYVRFGAQIIMLQQIFLIAVCLNFRFDNVIVICCSTGTVRNKSWWVNSLGKGSPVGHTWVGIGQAMRERAASDLRADFVRRLASLLPGRCLSVGQLSEPACSAVMRIITIACFFLGT